MPVESAVAVRSHCQTCVLRTAESCCPGQIGQKIPHSQSPARTLEMTTVHGEGATIRFVSGVLTGPVGLPVKTEVATEVVGAHLPAVPVADGHPLADAQGRWD